MADFLAGKCKDGYMQYGGRSASYSYASSPKMVSQDLFTAAGDYAGTTMAPVDDRPPMPYTESTGRALVAAGKMGYGGAQGLVNGVVKLGVDIAKGLTYLGAGAGDLANAAIGSPSSNYLDRTIDATRSVTGEVWPYAGDFERMGGYPGEMASPAAYGKASQLLGKGLQMGADVLGPTLESLTYRGMQRQGLILNAVEESSLGVNGVSGGPGQLSQIQVNAKNGAAFQARVANFGDDSLEFFHQEVSIRPNTADGVANFRVRLDGVGTNRETATVNLLEAKSSISAPLTKRQSEGFPLIEKYGGTIVGKNGGSAYPAGTEIAPNTAVRIIRPNDLPKGY